VQLRDPPALGRLHHHHRGVRDVDADLDHARRHEHVEFAASERAHPALALGGGKLAVYQSETQTAQLAAGESFELGGRCAHRERLGLLDQGTDDERLVATRHLGADAGERLASPTLAGQHERLDRLAAPRQLA